MLHHGIHCSACGRCSCQEWRPCPKGFHSETHTTVRDKINYYRKEYEKKCKRGALHDSSDFITPESLALAGLPQNDERGATYGSALVVITPESLLASSLPQDDDTGQTRK
jgi:hypothetical protein